MANARENILLLQNGFAVIPAKTLAMTQKAQGTQSASAQLGTVLSNMAYYGYAPSVALLKALLGLKEKGLTAFWRDLEPMLAEITGADRNMDDFVVYKNFPKEVLEMSRADYWVRQICMYIGFPNEIFTQEAAEREPLRENLQLKVLDLAGEDVYERVFQKLIASGASWQPAQAEAMFKIINRVGTKKVDIGAFAFRGNGVALAVEVLKNKMDISVSTTSATDVLRIAAGLSDGDMELREKVKFRKFSRPERRMLVEMLNGCADLEGDFGRRAEVWKRLLSRLHPGDYKFERVNQAYADLYAGSKSRLAARLERAFASKDAAALDLLAGEPGVFMRELRRAYGIFGKAAFDRFMTVTDQLTVEQLLKISGVLETATETDLRADFARLVRPRGNWSKTKAIPASTTEISIEDRNALLEHIGKSIGARIDAVYPEGISLDPAAFDVTLATNGQELASYGRGTEFDIPENVTFVRTASFWAHSGWGNTWFDNGWNLFAEDWTPYQTCAWDQERVRSENGTLAVFSGDPTNSKDLEGRGCQMIDLYLKEMEEAGIAYAVWNILCYSHVPFEDAKEVLATLQWGEEPMQGKLYEPSRAQMVFPLKGKEMTKFLAYIDVRRRKLVYMDAGFPGQVSSATRNIGRLSELMPAFQAYTRSLPTVGALFAHAKPGTLPVVKSDANFEINGPAYVFERRNNANQVTPIDLEPLLGLKGRDADRILAEQAASTAA